MDSWHLWKNVSFWHECVVTSPSNGSWRDDKSEYYSANGQFHWSSCKGPCFWNAKAQHRLWLTKVSLCKINIAAYLRVEVYCITTMLFFQLHGSNPDPTKPLSLDKDLSLPLLYQLLFQSHLKTVQCSLDRCIGHLNGYLQSLFTACLHWNLAGGLTSAFASSWAIITTMPFFLVSTCSLRFTSISKKEVVPMDWMLWRTSLSSTVWWPRAFVRMHQEKTTSSSLALALPVWTFLKNLRNKVCDRQPVERWMPKRFWICYRKSWWKTPLISALSLYI